MPESGPNDLRPHFRQVLFIGGGTDAGKSSVAQQLAARRGWPVYHADRTDAAHHRRLAGTRPEYAAFLNADTESAWLRPEPSELARRAARSFHDRLPLVLDDLTGLWLPPGMCLIAEGFGFTPELIAPLLSGPQQAVFLIPTTDFKRTAMERRGKPVWASQVRDPLRARRNLEARDALLSAQVVQQAHQRGQRVIEVDGSASVAEIAEQVESHFDAYLSQPE